MLCVAFSLEKARHRWRATITMEDQCEERDPRNVYTPESEKGVLVTNATHSVGAIIAQPFSIYNSISSWSQPMVTTSHITNRQLVHIICFQLGLMWTEPMPPCPQNPPCLCKHAYLHTHNESYTWKSSQPDPRLLSFRGLPTDSAGFSDQWLPAPVC